MELRISIGKGWALDSLDVMKGILVGVVFAATAQVLASKPSPHVPKGIVSDWTQRHVHYPDSKDESVIAPFRDDPRWEQNWYLRHREAWWPEYHPEPRLPDEVRQSEWPREHRREPRRPDEESKRDWSISLGTDTFQPIIDFSFSISPETAFGSLNVTDQGGGNWLATAGSLTVTGGSDVGTYTLIPGGPGVTTSPLGSFLYDNVITTSANPALDVDGLLFGITGKELNVWGNSANNYSFYDSTGPGVYGTQLTATVML